MSTLYILNGFSLLSNGNVKSLHQVTASSAPQEPLAATVSGAILHQSGSIPDDGIYTLYSSSGDFPQTFDYLYLVADQDVYIQMFASADSVVFKLEANTPFTLPGFGSFFKPAPSTAISVEPTLVPVSTVLVANFSGTAANYTFAIID